MTLSGTIPRDVFDLVLSEVSIRRQASHRLREGGRSETSLENTHEHPRTDNSLRPDYPGRRFGRWHDPI